MIINHNMNAMNAHRLMTGNTAMAGKSMEKLSSGLRINRAGDDAAGLAISEKMRAQIRGLDQASRNAQDGVSLIQTAEGALNETHSILQRMRELATQAANDTNVTVDRKEIQKEMNQLTSEVNRIGNTTEFNTKKLLSSGVSPEDRETILKGLKSWWISEGARIAKDGFGLEVPDNTEIKVVLDSDLGSAAAKVSAQYYKNTSGKLYGKGMGLELHINVSASKPLDLSKDTNGGKAPQYVDRVIAHEMTHAIMSQTMNFGSLNTWFKEGMAEFAHGADERLKVSIGKLGITNVVNKIGDGTTWGGDSDSYSAAYLAVRYLDKQLESEGGIKKIIEHLNKNDKATLSDAIGNTTKYSGKTEAEFINEFKTAIKNEATMTTLADIDLTNKDTGSVLGKDNGGADLNAEDVVKETAAEADVTGNSDTVGKFKVTWPAPGEGSPEVKLQIGANEGQSLTIELKDMRAGALKISGSSVGGSVTSKDGTVTAKYAEVKEVNNGTDNQSAEYALDVSTHDNASAAIKIVNDAIENVSSFRSELGAYQNRLEHTINNLNNSSENLTASESRVRDVDMAKEMMTFSKKNILSQAAQAMLAQANQQPQGVLQLLR